MKLRAWPGARCEILAGLNKGARVVVLGRDDLREAVHRTPIWTVVSLCGPLVVQRDGEPTGEVAVKGPVADYNLRPLPDLDDPQTVETVEEVVE